MIILFTACDSLKDIHSFLDDLLAFLSDKHGNF